jgi:hypothetical protein
MATRMTVRAMVGFVALLALQACGDDEGTDDGALADAGRDAGERDGGKPPVNRPIPYDAGQPPECTRLMPASCDGSEDCSGGQVCCANRNADTNVYESVQCQDACPVEDGFHFIACHADADCVEGEVCRVSQGLHVTYILLCKVDMERPPPTQPSVAAGEVSCGESQVCGAGQKCCVRTGNAELGGDELGNYCSDAEQACSCDFVEPLPEDPDGGGSDAG